MNLTIRPLTPSLWPALEALFGKGGASNGCWCMYWRIGPEYHKRPRDKNKSALRRIVKQGPPPGLLAFDGDLAVGWCQLTPRQDLSWLNRRRTLQALDDMPVWSISCFYVRHGYRRKGVMASLIREALKTAKRADVPAVEELQRISDIVRKLISKMGRLRPTIDLSEPRGLTLYRVMRGGI